MGFRSTFFNRRGSKVRSSSDIENNHSAVGELPSKKEQEAEKYHEKHEKKENFDEKANAKSGSRPACLQRTAAPLVSLLTPAQRRERPPLSLVTARVPKE